MSKFRINKAVALFVGNDSYSRPVTVAYDASGQAWSRVSSFNGYGVAPSKWAIDNACPSLEQACADKRIPWGFKTLSGGMVQA